MGLFSSLGMSILKGRVAKKRRSRARRKKDPVDQWAYEIFRTPVTRENWLRKIFNAILFIFLVLISWGFIFLIATLIF